MGERTAVIVGGVRTAIGAFGGALKDVSAVDLGATVVREALVRCGLAPADVSEVVLGNVLQAGLGQNPARQAALRAGLPQEVPSMTINKVCGSGLEAVVRAAQAVLLGDAEVVVAGGMESMSQAPYLLPAERWGQRMGHGRTVDVMIQDGLQCAMNDCHMGITAENVARKYELSRAAQDAFAAESQRRVAEALASGRFAREIVAVEIPQRKGDPVRFEIDEHPRAGTTMETLAKLRPAFDKAGTVTAGNASGINDGAAAVVVTSAELARERELPVLGRIRAHGSAGVDPALMGLGPVPAVRQALARCGRDVASIDLWELNEAFAAQSLAVVADLGIDPERVNVSGGAIALGHPIGASGARVLVTLLYLMAERGATSGVAALCIGGGQGIAMVIER